MFETGVGSAPVVSRARDAALLRRARDCGPGPAALGYLDRIDAAGLCEADRVDLLACWESHEGWLLARRAAALIAVAGTSDPATADEASDELAEESVRMQVGAALRVTPTTAGHRIDTARFLAAHPGLVEALSAGRVGYGHVAVLDRELATASSPQVVDAVLAEVLPGVDADTPSRLRMRARRSLARLDAEAVRRRIAAAATDRSCGLDADPDLVGRITVTGPWQMTAWAFRQFDAWARVERDRLTSLDPGTGVGAGTGIGPGTETGPGAGRPSLSALRADAVVEAARLLALSMGCPGTDRPASGDGTPARGRSWSTAVVVCDLPTALGVADEPGFVPGYGPVPAAVARELLAQAETWRRFLVHDGTLVDTGATRYRPTGRLRELVTARDQTCVFPGCTVPATLADLDHTNPFDGTNTTGANLRPLCRRHHRVKTHVPGWRLRSRDGTPEWTAPTGHRYPAPPQPLWQITDRVRRDGHRRSTLTRAGWTQHPTRAA